jgi:DNA polymerase elongation subunit (family B)
MQHRVSLLEKRLKLYKCLFPDFVIWEQVRRNIEDYHKIKEHMVAIACQVHLEKGKIPPGSVLMEIVIEEDVSFIFVF